jgi:predicted small secreted protein
MTVSRGQLIASGGSVALSAALAACGSNTGRGDGSSGSQGAALQQ